MVGANLVNTRAERGRGAYEMEGSLGSFQTKLNHAKVDIYLKSSYKHKKYSVHNQQQDKKLVLNPACTFKVGIRC